MAGPATVTETKGETMAITYTIDGNPNNTNPIACMNMASLLSQLSTSLPGREWDLDVIGIRIERVDS